jgi:hypothetical protein
MACVGWRYATPEVVSLGYLRQCRQYVSDIEIHAGGTYNVRPINYIT